MHKIHADIQNMLTDYIIMKAISIYAFGESESYADFQLHRSQRPDPLILQGSTV